MKSLSSVLKLLAEAFPGRSDSRGHRLHLLEPLETRCVLSSFGMPPMMPPHPDFGHDGGDPGGPPGHFPSPEFGRGMDGGRDPFGGGEFGPRMQHGPAPFAPLGDFHPEPEHELLPRGNVSYVSSSPMVIVVVMNSPPPVLMEAARPPASPILERPGRGLELSGNSTASIREPNAGRIAADATGIVAPELELPAARANVATLAAATTETLGLKSRTDSAREDDATPRRGTKVAPDSQVNTKQADGLIELATDEIAQRFKRKAERGTKSWEQPLDIESEGSGRVLRQAWEAIPVSRLPLQTESYDRVLAGWQAKAPAWSPEEAGLVEILAVDVVSSAGARSLALKPAPSVLRDSSSTGLRAEIGLYHAFDLATEVTSDLPLISTTANPLASAPSLPPTPEAKAE